MLRNTVAAVLGGIFILAWGAVSAQQAEVVTVTQTEIKRIAGEVVEVRSNLLTLRADDGSGRSSYRIPRGASISVAGVQTRLQDLQPGQKIRIYYRETETGRVIVLSPPEETEVVTMVEEVEVIGAAAGARAAAGHAAVNGQRAAAAWPARPGLCRTRWRCCRLASPAQLTRPRVDRLGHSPGPIT